MSLSKTGTGSKPFPGRKPGEKPGPKMGTGALYERRLFIEHVLAQGLRPGLVIAKAKERYPEIGVTQLRVDVRRIRVRWAKQDGPQLEETRMRQVRMMEACARRLYRIGDFNGAARVRRDVARLLGMGSEFTLNVKGGIKHTHEVKAPSNWLVELAQAMAEQGRLPKVVDVEASVTNPGAPALPDGGEDAA